MDPYPYTIEYYCTRAGRRPFKEWMDSLDVATRARVRVRLDRAALGNLGARRFVGGGVCELKIDFGPAYRVYFALSGKRAVLLLLGGDKSTQSSDITLAKGYLKDFINRGKS